MVSIKKLHENAIIMKFIFIFILLIWKCFLNKSFFRYFLNELFFYFVDSVPLCFTFYLRDATFYAWKTWFFHLNFFALKKIIAIIILWENKVGWRRKTFGKRPRKNPASEIFAKKITSTRQRCHKPEAPKKA